MPHVLKKEHNFFSTQMNYAFPREMYYLAESDPEDKKTLLFLVTAK